MDLVPERKGVCRTLRADNHTGDTMNENQVKGKFEQLKGRAKRAWGELTDDDFKKAEGSVDKLYGIIREKVGDTEEEIRRKLNRDVA